MQFLEYLAIIRRRWYYPALGLFVGLIAGYLTAPGAPDRASAFQATTTMLVNSDSAAGSALNLDQTALVVETGAVPQRVSQRLSDSDLRPFRSLTALPDEDLRSIDITAIAANPKSAAAAANLAAEELNAELTGSAQSRQQAELADARTKAGELQDRISTIDQRLAGMSTENPNRGVLTDQRKALASSYQDAQEHVTELELGDRSSPLRVLQAGVGKPYDSAGLEIPTSKPTRALLLGLFGLILGTLGAIAAARLDKRVRHRIDAEQAFGLPVIAEIPPLPSGVKGRELLAETRPASPFVEAHRALRTVVLFAADEEDAARREAVVTQPMNGSAPPVERAQVILITSPAAGEGKTTTAAHLAAVLAEFGKRVLVVSGDFRRPRIHELFGAPREPGISEVLESAGEVRLSDLQMATRYPGVHLLPSGGSVTNPAQLLTETRQLIAAARPLFDFIIVDTPPVLVANDATELTGVADMVMLMAKADRTSREAAARSVEILRRVEAPMLGVVVSSAHDMPTAYGYYRYRYYSDNDAGGGRRAAKKRQKAEAAAVSATVGVDET